MSELLNVVIIQEMSRIEANATIFHGTDCKPGDFWYPWIGQQLKKRGYKVNIPSLPQINHEPVSETLKQVLEGGVFNRETVLIGHSAGGPLVLSVLESLKSPIKQAVLVAGYARRIDQDPDPVLQASYDWKKIAGNVGDIVFLNSDNDPWGCDDAGGRFMLDSVGRGRLVVMKGEGHMGSETYNQPYKQFPFLLRLIG